MNLKQGAFFRVHGGVPELFGIHFTETFEALHRHVGAALPGLFQLFQFGVVKDVLGGFALAHAIKGRLGDIDIAGFDELRHIMEQKRQKQGADVSAVDVGIGHDDELVIPGLAQIKFTAVTGAHGGEHGLNFGVAHDSVDAGFLDVEDFPAQRQNGLNFGVAPLFGRAAGGVPFHQ